MKNSIFGIVGIIAAAVLAISISGCQQDAEHEHTFAESWTSDTTGHWHAATCEHKSEISGKADHVFGEYTSNNDATTEADGTKSRTCTVCGFKETVADSDSKIHVHTFAESWTSDTTGHWHAATCEHTTVTSGKAAHEWNSGEITTPATCTEKGVKTYTCTICKATKTEGIAAAGHTEGSGTVTTPANCTADGEKTYFCTVCSAVLRTETIKATGHIEKQETTAATCVTAGKTTYRCSVCGTELREEEIPVLYASPIDAETNAAPTAATKYVYFGAYPQTIAAATVTVDENTSVTKGAKTYYKGSDGEYYAKASATYTTSENPQYSDGTYPVSGKSRYFKVEPVKWRVCTGSYDYDGDSGTDTAYLLVAEKIIDAQLAGDYNNVFDCKNIHLCYDKTNIHNFLNGDNFLKAAFIEDAYNKWIKKTVISYSTTYERSAITEGQIFLLGLYEVDGDNDSYCISTDDNLKRLPTDYTKNFDSNDGIWGLRDYEDSWGQYHVLSNGELAGLFTYDGSSGNSNFICPLVPALCIKF